MQTALQPVNDPQSNPEPAAPSLPAPDPGIFHPPPPRPQPPNPRPPASND
ncbi:MAG TPA: hypothetical protein VK814_06410 [Acidobacteriaceae bacterium]|nr:hypothetical protein [Acidobacteriaceae bacterium]